MTKKIPKALKAKFEDLFDSKDAAVICYLSLERRYIALNKRLDAIENPVCCKCQYLKVVSVPDYFKCRVDNRGSATQTELRKDCYLVEDQ